MTSASSIRSTTERDAARTIRRRSRGAHGTSSRGRFKSMITKRKSTNDGPGVHQHLDGPHEMGVQEHVEAGHGPHSDDEEERGVDRVPLDE